VASAVSVGPARAGSRSRPSASPRSGGTPLPVMRAICVRMQALVTRLFLWDPIRRRVRLPALVAGVVRSSPESNRSYVRSSDSIEMAMDEHAAEPWRRQAKASRVLARRRLVVSWRFIREGSCPAAVA
jgi:hypothetical protein